MSDKLHIKNEMSKFDNKDRDFYDSLSDEEKKKFSPYLMIRWGATVDAEYWLQAYYLMSCNERLNKNFFDISTKNHKKLQWLMATTVSPGGGTQYHPWLAAKKKEGNTNKIEKLLSTMYPWLKPDELKLMAKLNDTKEIKKLAKDYGMTDSEIKELG
jgi:hypothetical protein